MVVDQIRNKLVLEKKSLLHSELIPHEKVSNRGINQLNNYIGNIHHDIILPSILICNKTLSLIHISEPTDRQKSRMPSSA